MTPFSQLTHDQQLTRLTAAAQAVTAAYALPDARITPLAYINNAVFRVESGDQRYTLRLARGQHDSWLRSELLWLEAITRDSGLCVPRPLRTSSGDLLAQAVVDGLDTPLWCALFAWVDGAFTAPDTITLAQTENAGAFLAALHHYSATFQPPPGFERPRLDWEGLFGQDSPYNPGDGARIFTAEQIEVFDAVAGRVRAVMDTLGTDPAHFGLIHADFIAKNYLFAGDTVCAIDFDTCAYGYYLYDLAPPLLQFSDEPRYEALKAALWRGYTRVRPLPADHRAHLETFVAARHVASCRWIAGNLANPKVRERAPHIIPQRVAELRLYLQTGRLERKSEIL